MLNQILYEFAFFYFFPCELADLVLVQRKRNQV